MSNILVNPLGGRSINKWSGLGPFQSRFSPWQVQFQHNPDLSNPRPAQCSLDHIYFSPRVQPLKDPVKTGRANTRPAQFPIKARPTPWNPPAGAYGTYTRRKSFFFETGWNRQTAGRSAPFRMAPGEKRRLRKTNFHT